MKFKFKIPVKTVFLPNETAILCCQDYKALLQSEEVMQEYGAFLSKSRIFKILKNAFVGEVDGLYVCLAEGEIEYGDTLNAFLKFMENVLDAPVPTYLGYFLEDGALIPQIVLGFENRIERMHPYSEVMMLIKDAGYVDDITEFVDCVHRDDGSLEMFFRKKRLIAFMGDSGEETDLCSVVLEMS